MAVTILAIVFLLFIVIIAVVGYKSITKRATVLEENKTEACSICKNRLDRSLLIERQVSDYKILYFCKTCVKNLYAQSASQ